MTTSLDEQFLFDVAMAARALSIGKTEVFELLNTNELRSVQIGRRRLIPRQAIEQYIARLQGAK